MDFNAVWTSSSIKLIQNPTYPAICTTLHRSGCSNSQVEPVYAICSKLIAVKSLVAELASIMKSIVLSFLKDGGNMNSA